MPDQDTTIDEAEATAEEIRSEPTEVTVVEVARTDEDRAENDDDVEPESTRSIVIRHVLERQLVAGHGLSSELVDAATDVTVALAQAPAGVVGEIRGGATLPTAFARTGTSVREVVTGAGGRVRSAVGEYVGNQATLPNAVVVGQPTSPKPSCVHRAPSRHRRSTPRSRSPRRPRRATTCGRCSAASATRSAPWQTPPAATSASR